MMIIPINTSTSSSGGNMSNKAALSMWIAFNLLILISFIIMCYLYSHDSYKGSFWEWSWDMDYFLKDKKTNAGIAWMFVWIPFFCVNGIALLNFLTQVILNVVFKGDK